MKENSIGHGLSMNTIYNMDCLEGMRLIPDNSIDSIVTDPPYEIGFMGKGRDNTGIANSVEMRSECLRILKPGGHLLSFAATRTYHRMASAIEDAGFEIRDMIEWCYGSGFPKSLNIGKAVARLQGEYIPKTKGFNVAGQGIGLNPNKELRSDHPNYVKPKFENDFDGWGTALKPAHEPICMARKPISEKTVAENCLKYGTGGINIDESRVGTELMKTRPSGKTSRAYQSEETTTAGGQGEDHTGRFPANLILSDCEEVRECFPDTKSGNLLPGHKRGDGTGNSLMGGGGVIEGTYGGDSGNASRFFKSIIYQAKASKSERNKGCEELEVSEKFTAGNYSQSPTCKTCELTLNGTNNHSECSGEVYYKEMESKNTKNNHPTVKPIALMEYLIKMVTKEGGIVLDPFTGSGTTLVAAKKNGYEYIGFELDEGYRNIANKRIQDNLSENTLFS